MSVYATDGSIYNLPATDKIREKFDPNSGLQNKGKGHYPQCLVSTLFDVFRRLPIARTVVGTITLSGKRLRILNLLFLQKVFGCLTEDIQVMSQYYI